MPPRSQGTNLPPWGPQRFWNVTFQGYVQGLFPLCLMLKFDFGPFCIHLSQMHVINTSLLRYQLPPFEQVHVILQFYSFIHFYFINITECYSYLCVFIICLCLISFSRNSRLVILEQVTLYMFPCACPWRGPSIKRWVSN